MRHPGQLVSIKHLDNKTFQANKILWIFGPVPFIDCQLHKFGKWSGRPIKRFTEFTQIACIPQSTKPLLQLNNTSNLPFFLRDSPNCHVFGLNRTRDSTMMHISLGIINYFLNHYYFIITTFLHIHALPLSDCSFSTTNERIFLTFVKSKLRRLFIIS